MSDFCRSLGNSEHCSNRPKTQIFEITHHQHLPIRLRKAFQGFKQALTLFETLKDSAGSGLAGSKLAEKSLRRGMRQEAEFATNLTFDASQVAAVRLGKPILRKSMDPGIKRQRSVRKVFVKLTSRFDERFLNNI